MFDYDAYFNTPEKQAENKAFMEIFKAERDAEAKRVSDAFKEATAILRAANAELKADNDAAELKEYNRLFTADKARYLDAGYTEQLAHELACSDAQYRENKKNSYSNE